MNRNNRPKTLNLESAESKHVSNSPSLHHIISKTTPNKDKFSVIQWIRDKNNKKSSGTNPKNSKNSSLEKDPSKRVGRNYLWIVFFVKKFIEILKTFNMRQKLKRLKTYHYNVIHDQSFFEEEIKDTSTGVARPFHDLWERTKQKRRILRKLMIFKTFYRFICRSIHTCWTRVEVFSPDNNFRIIWDFLVLFALVANVFYIPLVMGFEIDLEAYRFLNTKIIANVLFNIIPNIVFVVDIFANMNTAYYSKGEYVSNRKKVLKNYIKTHFIVDFLTVGPVVLRWIADSSFSFREIDIFFVIRLNKLKGLLYKMDEYMHMEDKLQGIFNLLKLLFVVLFVAHVCGCSWNYLAIVQIKMGIPDNWHMR